MDIIERIKDGDERALEKVIDKYSKLLWKIAGEVLSGYASCEIEECVADVFIYLWEHPEKYDPERGKLSTFLGTVAKSKAIDRLRKLSKERDLLIHDVLSLPDEEESIGYDGFENDIDEIRFLIEKLSEKEREVVIRRFYHDEKNAEIAAVMGLNSKQVENLLYTAKQKLRRWLGTVAG